MDRDLESVQKVHAFVVPRVGGVGIAIAVALTLIIDALWYRSGSYTQSLVLLACSLPAFLSGLVEDLTKRVSSLVRLITSMIVALLACIGTVVGHVGLS